MVLTSSFFVSATTPRMVSEPGPGGERVAASLHSWGGHTAFLPGFNLSDQLNDDALVAGYAPADPDDESDVTDLASGLFAHSGFSLLLKGIDVAADRQYLLIFGLQNRQETTMAQFFVGTSHVRSEIIDGDDRVALLLDAPGPEAIWVTARLASHSYWAAFALKGIQGFLI